MATSSDFLNLTNWKITLPVDVNGGITGKAAEITNLKGYEHSKYFFDSPDGGVTFRAMVDGATTGGTKYARSELREMKGTERAAWDLKEGGTMTATLKIDEAPTKNDGTVGRFIVGQIHGKEEELIRMYWENGKVYFVNDIYGPKADNTTFQLYDSEGKTPNVSIGEHFSYKIDAFGDKMKVDVFADGKTYTNTMDVHPIWQTDLFYFKAGVYLGVNETQGTGAGQATFYGLDFSHKRGEGLGGLVLKDGTVTDPVVDDTDTKPVDTKPVDTKPIEVKPVDPKPVDTKPVETKPIETKPVDITTDKLRGTDSDDTVRGKDIAETMSGANGNDILHGNGGDDVIWGNNGIDTLIGGLGKDVLKGGDGKDIFVYNSVAEGGDTILDFRKYEVVDISGVTKDMSKDAYNLTISGLKEKGFIILKDTGVNKTDIMIDLDGAKGSGKSVLLASVDHDGSLYKDDAFLAKFTAPVVSTPGTTPGTVDSVHNKAEVLKGTDGNNTLYGHGGDDQLWGLNGDDRLVGGAGKDWLKGGEGNDTFVFEDIIDAGDKISDFRTGDKIDLAALVDDFSNDASHMSFDQLKSNGFLSIKDTGDRVNEIYVDLDGASGSGKAVLLATVFGDDTVKDASSFIL